MLALAASLSKSNINKIARTFKEELGYLEAGFGRLSLLLRNVSADQGIGGSVSGGSAAVGGIALALAVGATVGAALPYNKVNRPFKMRDI